MVTMGEQNNTLQTKAKEQYIPSRLQSESYNIPPVLITLKLFDTMVLPILSYGAEIWGFMEDSNLEAVELHYLKHILHVPLTASNIAVRGELGQLPIHLIWERKNIEILG